MSQTGDAGTEQYTVTTRVNGELIKEQPIHDPFATTMVKLKGLGHAWRALTKGIDVVVSIDGTHGAVAAVMTLDPAKLKERTQEHLRSCAESRARNAAEGVHGYYSETQAVTK